MELQNVIVMLVVLAAFTYAAIVVIRKTRSFSVKRSCADDCGCGSSDSKTKRIAH